jgi:hypothetical protein
LGGTRLGHSFMGAAMRPAEFKIPLKGLDGFLLVLQIVGIEYAEREIHIDVIRIGY